MTDMNVTAPRKHQPFVPDNMKMTEFTVRAVLLGLDTHTAQQLRAADAVREARMIMGDRDPKRPAVAVVDHRDPAMGAREIDRGRQSGRSTADDQAVELLH